MTNPISQFLQERIDANDFPSAVYLVAEKGEIVFQDALGYAVIEPERIPARLDTIYDLASLTKPLITGLLTAQRIEDKDVHLDDPVGKFLPAFLSNGKPKISIGQLLTHTSGFSSWIPLYLKAGSLLHASEAVYAEPLSATPNSQVIYSDLNFITLADIIESMAHFRIDVVATDISDALDLKNTGFNPMVQGSSNQLCDVTQIAACEKGNEYEKQTCIDLGYLKPQFEESDNEFRISHSPFRTQTIWGEVHDGNAYFMGGVAGHAGLFSTAEEVFKIALQFLPNYTTLLKPETCELFRTNFTPGMNEARSFAFQLAETPESTAGSKMSPQSFGHLGFTGTSLWIDPVKDRIFVLLTNRTHAHPLPFVNINSVRRRFHDLANDLLDEKT
jgi:CubicO group peptidase (beta-lactamase class C family)